MTNIRHSVCAHPMLSADEVHIWYANLNQNEDCIQQMIKILSVDERMRADRFYFKRDREHFIAGRGVLRKLLGLYLDMKPDQLQFQYGSHGKPYIDEENAPRFNLSHSHGLAIYAFILDREVGVDLEYIRDIEDMEQIAESFFSRGDNAMLKSLPIDQRQEAFYNCWTRKEAYIKAIGDGLAHPLDQFDVSMIPGEPARLLNVVGDADEADHWQMEALMPAPGYIAAVAVEGHGWKLRSWQWTEE